MSEQPYTPVGGPVPPEHEDRMPERENVVQPTDDERQAAREDSDAALEARINAAVERRLAEQRGATAPENDVPEHAGGIGHAIHETWSQAEQELARLGHHPDQKEA